jgi:hypothetical protein
LRISVLKARQEWVEVIFSLSAVMGRRLISMGRKGNDEPCPLEPMSKVENEPCERKKTSHVAD